MLRTQISLTVAQRRVLDEEAERTGRSISALIRSAIMQTYGSGSSLERDLRTIDEASGAWDGRDFGGAEYVDRLRSGRRTSDLTSG